MLRAVVFALVLLNTFVAGVATLNLRRSYDQRQEQATLGTQSLSRLLERNLDAIIDRVDLSLLAASDEHARQLAAGIQDGAALVALLARQQSRTPAILSLRMTDAAGNVLRGVPATTESASSADREYFRTQRDSPSVGLFLSRPIVGRILKVPLIFLSRRLNRPDGAFDGVIYATISLEHIASILAEVEVGPRGATLLRYQDLSAVVRRSSGVVEPLLSPSEPSPPLRVQVAAGQTAGVYTAVAPKDGIQRTYGWRKVGDRPFYVLVGVAQDDLLATWWPEVMQAAVLLALFAAVTALGAWFALRSLRTQQASTDALRESEARLAATFSSFPDALVVTRADGGELVLVNERFARTTGWSSGEVLGRRATELPLWSDRAQWDTVAGALASRGSLDDFEAVLLRRDGSRFNALLTGRLVSLEDGRYQYIVIRDITRQRQLEEQLQQARRLESVGRLAGGVAHDFNNMLLVILGEAEILSGDLPPDHPAQAGVREIARAGARSRDLTRQLLALSRKQTISPRVVNLNALVEATKPALLRLLGEDIQLLFEPAPDLLPVLLDPSQFDQVLVNLVVNARDAMPGGGRIIVRSANARLEGASGPGLEALPPGDYALLSVSDDGHGMDEATLAHLFEPFFTTKAEGKGTGLGLATTYGVVQQNGGAIRAESNPGKGSTFTLYLPATSEPLAVAAAPAPSPARGQGTILLAEDEEPVRRTTRRILESLGYRVLEAGSGEEALAVAQGARLDLFVTDVMLPGMKGPEISQRLQALRPGLPTLFLSGYTSSALGSRGVLDPGVHFLSKPFSVRDLALKVEEAMRGGVVPA